MATAKNTIEEMQKPIDDQQKRIEALEAEFYKRGFWTRPQPPKPVLPMARATNCDWHNEPAVAGGMIHIRFAYDCACGNHHADQVVRVPTQTPQGFSRNVTCANGKVVEVVFPHR